MAISNDLFDHVKMEEFKIADFIENSERKLSVGLQGAINGDNTANLIDNMNETLMTCSAIILIDNTQKRAILYHYPACYLCNEIKEVKEKSKILGLFNQLRGVDCVYIYTGCPRGCNTVSIQNDQQKIIKTIQDRMKDRKYEIKCCFVASGTAYVYYDGANIITGTTGQFGKLYSYDRIPKTGCTSLDNTARASIYL